MRDPLEFGGTFLADIFENFGVFFRGFFEIFRDFKLTLEIFIGIIKDLLGTLRVFRGVRDLDRETHTAQGYAMSSKLSGIYTSKFCVTFFYDKCICSCG